MRTRNVSGWGSIPGRSASTLEDPRRGHGRTRVWLPWIALMLGACTGATQDRVLGVDATAAVTAEVRLDGNGSGQVDPSDPGVAAVRVRLRMVGTPHVVSSGPSNAEGAVVLSNVPVGTYRLEVDESTVGDTVEIVSVSRSDLVLGAGEQVSVTVLLGYPRATVGSSRDLPVGRRVFVEGVALNARTHFGDNTIHVADSTGFIRTTRPGAVNVVPGDSIRVLGTRSVLDGQPTLDQVAIFALGPGSIPVARILSSAVAATADDGRLDAGFVRVTSGTVIGHEPTPAGVRLVVDDGSGPLVVQLDALDNFPVANYRTGAVLDVRGVLVPTDAPGQWAVRPRVVSDVIILFLPDPDE